MKSQVIHENIKTVFIGKKLKKKIILLLLMDYRILISYYCFKEKTIIVIKKHYDNGTTVNKIMVHSVWSL